MYIYIFFFIFLVLYLLLYVWSTVTMTNILHRYLSTTICTTYILSVVVPRHTAGSSMLANVF